MGQELASLVTAAAGHDQDAWNTIVERYAGLVWAVARGYRLSTADASDVSQATWLRLVEHLHDLRDPAAVGGWLATTARREAAALLRKRREVLVSDPEPADPSADDGSEPWQGLLAAERNVELWRAFALLTERCQAMLRVLVIDPASSYAAAAATLDIPVGSLGPSRARCLATLRRHLEEDGGDDA